MTNKVVKTKVCKVCGGDPQPLKNFVVHKNYKDGHSNTCKVCNKNKYQLSFRTKVLDGLREIKEKIDNL
jgi:hypothetical protein